MSRTDDVGDWHVMPLKDLVEHEDSEDCACGPTPNPVKRDDGSIGWVHTHHSLDGRERKEHANDRWNLPLHRTEAGYPNCSTCDGGGCPDCTDPA